MLGVAILFVSLACSALAATNCHGDINRLHVSGMRNGGIAQSNAAVDYRYNSCNAWKSCFDQVANKYCVEAAVLGAIASRESNCGDSLAADGTGDNGNAWGMMQCDLRYSGLPCKNCPAKSCCHIDMLVSGTLIPFINQISSKFPSWSVEQKLQGGLAAYNMGPGNVNSWDQVDARTTGQDYSNDVIARAQHFKNRYGWS